MAPASLRAQSDGASQRSDDLDIDAEFEGEAAKAAEPKTIQAKAQPQATRLFDEPDREVEKKFNRQYRIHAQPLSEDRWDALVDRQRAEEYRVRKGNTLSGISKSLFGDPSYWPKLWSENGVVENPHLIEPGKSIRFSAGTEEEGPAISLVDADRAASEAELPPPSYEEDAAAGGGDSLAPSVADELELEPPTIPESESKGKKLLEDLPRSFVSLRPPSSIGYDSSGVDAVRNKARTVPAVAIPSHYWAAKTPSGVGSIVEIEAGEEVAGLQQDVFVRLSKPASKGKAFSVVFPTGPARVKDSPAGEVLEVGGRVRIVEAVDARKRLYRAVVTQSVGAIRKGGVLIDEALPRMNFTRKGPIKSVAASVIGGEFEDDRRVLGAGSVIYLDAGGKSGLEPGDLLAVQALRSSHRENTEFPSVAKTIGVAKIVYVQPNGSTAFLIEAREEVRPGDFTGGPLPAAIEPNVIADRVRIVDVDAETRRERDQFEAANRIRP